MRCFFSLLLLTFIHSSSYGQSVADRPGNNGVSFDYSMRVGCQGDTVFLSNTSSLKGQNFNWDFGDGSATDNVNANPVHVYRKRAGEPGKFVVTLTYTNSNNPEVKSTYSLPVSVAHPLSVQISVPETSVCWLVPMSFTAETAGIKPVAYAWDFGNGANATDREVDYTYPDPGTYNVKLTVTDNAGCAATAKTNVSAVKITAYVATNDTAVCLREPMEIRAYAIAEPSSVPYSLEWTPAQNLATTASATTSFFGVGDFVYTVTARTAYPSCIATDTEAIHSYPPVTLSNVTPAQTIPQGGIIRLNATGAAYYVWSPANGVLDNPNVGNPVATPVDPVTKFTVWGMSEYGCLDSASVTITTTNMGISDIVPSAFTPNGDGLNDEFRISSNTIQKLIDFKVFNRWGKQMFRTTNRDMGWDGTCNGVPQEVGVYTYQIVTGNADGSVKTHKGTVTLIR